MGSQGCRRTRKLCRAQQSSITRSRTPSFHRRIRSFTMRQRFTLLLTCSMRSRRWWSAWWARCCSRVSSAPRGFFVGMRISTWGERERQEAQILQQPTPGRERVGGGLRNAQIMHTATVGVTEKEDREEGIHEQDIFDRMILFLPAITVRLFNRVLGADDASFGPVMGKRGEAGTAAGPATTGAGASSSRTTTVATSASETPRRWARAVRERAGASPRVHSAASSTGKSTWIH